MDFKINNRYWLDLFVKDFLESKRRIFEWQNIHTFSINSFGDRYVYKDRVPERQQRYFEYILKKYGPCLSDCILVTKKNIEKHKIVMDFFDFKKKCDKENQLGLKDIKFDLIDLSEGIESYGEHYYLIACDINKEIDFELSYGTFKVLNKT